MRALVTGAAGFIGSTLTDRLLAEGWTVHGVDVLTDYYDPEMKRSNIANATAHPAFTGSYVDLRTSDLAPLLDGVDVVFHLAAQPGVRGSWAERFRIVRRPEHPCYPAAARSGECQARYSGCVRFVVVGVRQPGTGAHRGDRPHAAVQPVWRHQAGRRASVPARTRTTSGWPVAILRYFTVYGPRQRPDMAIHRSDRSGSSADPVPALRRRVAGPRLHLRRRRRCGQHAAASAPEVPGAAAQRRRRVVDHVARTRGHGRRGSRPGGARRLAGGQAG